MSFYTSLSYFLAGFEEPGLGFALEVFGFRIDRFSCNGLLPMRTGFGSLLFITITSLISTSQTLTGGDVLFCCNASGRSRTCIVVDKSGVTLFWSGTCSTVELRSHVAR